MIAQRNVIKEPLFLTFSACIHLCLSTSVLSQDLESLNKKELKSLCHYQSRELDSLDIVLRNIENKLQSSLDELYKNSQTIINQEKKIQENLNIIQDLASRNKESAVTISEQNAVIIRLEEQTKLANLQYLALKEYSDSLHKIVLNKPEKAESALTKTGTKNWLDSLGFSGTPLPDGSLKFQFEGIIAFNNHFQISRWDWRDGLIYGPIPFAPEVILEDQLQFNYIKIENYDSPIVIVKTLSSAEFQAMMPSLEIIKGKVGTLKFADGSEEDFLVTIKNIYNNGILTRQLNFANETAITNETFGSSLNDAYKESKDLFYPVYEISGKKYICLNDAQLIRLKVRMSMSYLSYDEDGEAILYDPYAKREISSDSMTEILLSRKTNESRVHFLPNSDCFFLFSLNP